MRKKGLAKLKSGDFNVASYEGQPDGSIVITLHKHGDKKTYRFRVRDLYGENEEEVNIATDKSIAKRNLQ